MKRTTSLLIMSLCVLSFPLNALTQNCEIDFTGMLLNSHVEQLYDYFYFQGEKEPRSLWEIHPDSNGDFEFLCLPQNKYWVVVMRSTCLWDSLGHFKSWRDTLFTFNSTLTDTAITLVEPCSYNEVEEKAKEDIENGTAKFVN